MIVYASARGREKGFLLLRFSSFCERGRKSVFSTKTERRKLEMKKKAEGRIHLSSSLSLFPSLALAPSASGGAAGLRSRGSASSSSSSREKLATTNGGSGAVPAAAAAASPTRAPASSSPSPMYRPPARSGSGSFGSRLARGERNAVLTVVTPVRVLWGGRER